MLSSSFLKMFHVEEKKYHTFSKQNIVLHPSRASLTYLCCKLSCDGTHGFTGFRYALWRVYQAMMERGDVQHAYALCSITTTVSFCSMPTYLNVSLERIDRHICFVNRDS